uniref:Uncharacterized protein n=1 Tax=Mesorhabditis belari TaxID=2138241 RepID=A0AAF3EJG5_9BILA
MAPYGQSSSKMTPYGQSSSSGYYHGSAYLRDSNQNENQQNQQNFQYFESPNYTTNNLNPYLYHETPKPDYSDSDEDEERVMADRVLHGLPKTIPQPEFRPSLSHSDHSFPHRPNGHLRLDSQAEASKMWHRNGRGRSDTISLTDGLYSIEETSRQMRGIPTAPEGPPPRRPTIENCKLKLNDWEKKRTWWKSGLTIVASFWLVFAALNLFAYIEMYENVKK